MPKRDLSGQRFDQLLITKPAASDEKGRRWWAKCDCGNITTISNAAVCTAEKKGVTLTCGHARKAHNDEYSRLAKLKDIKMKRSLWNLT